MAKYGREGDRPGACRPSANQLRHDKPARRVIKSSRWLLLRNRKNLDPCQSVKFGRVAPGNQPLLTAYLMRG
ncbi:putative iSBma1, transposase [Bordetella holmesii 1058]|uniref:ISBma1, transposase n=1 Tax=Bordetella holmesii 1058 TaxID=1247648 RepID=A0ABN0S472_9BORD|nr:putative iSBma1, transposase [Bordetella holmesii 1058]